MAETFQDLKKKLTVRKPASPPGIHLSTGSVLLNLAVSGKIDGGFLKGTYVFLVGDSAAGKSFMALTCLAEAARDKRFKDHRLIFDNAEGGALMDFTRFFGQAMASRLEPPGKKGEHSRSVEDFYYHLDDVAKAGKPFIYVLDSMDALNPLADSKKFQQQKTAHRKGSKKAEEGTEGDNGEKVKGSYGTAKAKLNSSGLREARNTIEDTGSILVIIAQTRDNVNAFSFEKKTRSGGKALRFYAATELWFSIVQSLKKTVNGRPRKIGTILQIQVKKNRQTGREPSVEIPFYPGSPNGFDETGSLVNFLIEEKHWGKSEKGGVKAPEFNHQGSVEKLIAKIEGEGREAELQGIVEKVWMGIEEQCSVSRKSRYE